MSEELKRGGIPIKIMKIFFITSKILEPKFIKKRYL